MSRPASASLIVAVLAVLTGVVSHKASAASFAFPTFGQVVDNTTTPGLDPESHPLTGAPAATYNAFTVSVSWSALAGDPYSEEALWAFTDTSDLGTASVIYADPGPAPNSTGNGASRMLTWSGYMDTGYQGGDSLHIVMAQNFEGSAASWDDVSISIFDAPRFTTAFTGLTDSAKDRWNRPSTMTTLSALATDVPYDVQPFYVDTTTQYQINSLFPEADGFMLVYEDQFDPNDQLTNIMGVFDLNEVGESESANLQLTAGKQYYIVLTGFENQDFGVYSGSIANNDPLQLGNAKLGLVPEPATLLLLAFPLMGPVIRRRHV